MPRGGWGGGRGRRGGLTGLAAPRAGRAGLVASGFLLTLAAASFLAAAGHLGPLAGGPAAVANLLLFGSAGAALLLHSVIRSRRLGVAIGLVIAAGALVRIGLAATAPVNYDTISFGIAVRALESGQVVYETTIRYNYSPVWAWLLLGVTRLGRALSFSPVVGSRLLLALGDALVAGMLYRLTRMRRHRRGAALVALAFWVNPVAMAVSSAHGQFDALAIGVYLVGLLWAARGASERSIGPSLVVGAAVALKQVVLLFVPAFVARIRSTPRLLRDLVLAAGPFGLLLLPYYLKAPAAVVDRVLRYASLYGLWGWYYILRLSGGVLPFRPALASYAALAAVAGVAFLAVRKGATPLAAARLSAVLFLALSPGFSIQMLVWPIALGPERRERPAAILFSVAGAAAYVGLIQFQEPQRLGLFVAWLACLAWAFTAFRTHLRGPERSVV